MQLIIKRRRINETGLFDNIKDAISARKVANIKYEYHPNHGKSV